MSPNDNGPDSRAEVIAAAHAAASWVRARRAAWSDVPLDIGAFEPAPEPPPLDISVFEPPPEPPAPLPPLVPEPVTFVPPAPLIAPVVFHQAPAAAPPVDEPAVALADEAERTPAAPRAPLSPWVARGAIAAAAVAAVVVGGPYVWRALPSIPSRPATPAPVAAPAAPVGARKPAAGALHVSSTPPGARVTVDGKARGVTPLDLRDLTPGRHEVQLASDAGSVTRTIAVSANATATVDESIFSGFVAVYAPFDVIVSEQGRPLTADERHQIMLPPGTHDLQFGNPTLVYETVKRVTIEPGEVTTVQLTPDPSPLTVTASEPAEVWLDGARLGETPLNAAPIPLGIHDIVVKRAAGGERRYTVTVGARPVVLKVDF